MAPCVCFPAVLLHIRANGLQVFPFKSSKLTLAKVSFLPANMLVFLTLAVFFFFTGHLPITLPIIYFNMYSRCCFSLFDAHFLGQSAGPINSNMCQALRGHV